MSLDSLTNDSGMRLLQITDGATADGRLEISLCEFLGSDIPLYAILSHRWREEEVLYADMVGTNRSIAQRKKGYAKLEATCLIALSLGFQYVWSDTCCIDKTSSAELSEAINSMYSYYTDSQWCIAYLDDAEFESEHDDSLSKSVWFTRGWTLQELIAPKRLTFYSKSWKEMGTKEQLCTQVSAASGIADTVLWSRDMLNSVSISEKMSWAARRVTTRPEDEAYSLMGIFGVNMATLYGEGRSNAFRRLQLEIMQNSSDHTLFAWNLMIATGDMLAPSVSCFADGADYEPSVYHKSLSQDLMPNYEMTNAGLRIQLPLRSIPSHGKYYFAFLACRKKRHHDLIAICLRWYDGSSSFPRFSREVFSKRTIYLLDESVARIATLPDFRLQPIWISADKSQRSASDIARLADRILKMDTIRYNVFIKARWPWEHVSLIGFQKGLSESTEYLASLSPQLPNFQASKLPLQQSIKGAFSCEGFEHRGIILGGSSQAGIDLYFGKVDTQIWVSATVTSPRKTIPEHRGTLASFTFASHTFPSGSGWAGRGRVLYDLLIPLQSLQTIRSFTKTSATGPLDLEIIADFENSEDSQEIVVTIAIVLSSSVGIRRVVNHFL
jgi:hypothetical protein